MESYFGLSSEQWYGEFQQNGMSCFSDRKIPDSRLIHILSRCCVGKEMVVPILKKDNWELNRFIRAESDFGIDEESLELVVGEYLILDEFDYSQMTPFEMRQYINKNYNAGTLSTQGAAALQNFRKF